MPFMTQSQKSRIVTFALFYLLEASRAHPQVQETLERTPVKEFVVLFSITSLKNLIIRRRILRDDYSVLKLRMAEQVCRRGFRLEISPLLQDVKCYEESIRNSGHTRKMPGRFTCKQVVCSVHIKEPNMNAVQELNYQVTCQQSFRMVKLLLFSVRVHTAPFCPAELYSLPLGRI